MGVKYDSSRLEEFFGVHPVFTIGEFAAWYRSRRPIGGRAVEAALNYHTRRGHLLRVRNRVYAVVAAGFSPQIVPVDPFLIASKLATDAIVAYHTSLALHGISHSMMQEFIYLTNLTSRPLKFRGQSFKAVRPPAALRARQAGLFGVETVDRMGLDVRVTSIERTLVDVLDRPQLGGGWEEIWRSLEAVEFFDLRKVVEYVSFLSNATTAAKVGFFLEQHRESLMVDDDVLRSLRERRPQSAHYLSRGEGGEAKLLRDWNLIVPAALVERHWQEVL